MTSLFLFSAALGMPSYASNIFMLLDPPSSMLAKTVRDASILSSDKTEVILETSPETMTQPGSIVMLGSAFASPPPTLRAQTRFLSVGAARCCVLRHVTSAG
eukprot:CAMPEP_0178393666 /NCGR_PEP_ID=MMETSP0689_2-20121128/12304_1 /TAXON_ID=160604 /ORGANISM="Amphidinium massartii, Strain CS-259" /LENGTH=101 /DNA_ID=CAMNT_0020014263 /DNA_START=183 /DNA_END=488 /DNA_ORIENTATION=-